MPITANTSAIKHYYIHETGQTRQVTSKLKRLGSSLSAIIVLSKVIIRDAGLNRCEAFCYATVTINQSAQNDVSLAQLQGISNNSQLLCQISQEITVTALRILASSRL